VLTTPGGYDLTATPVDVRTARRLNLLPGSYSITASPVDLTKVGVVWPLPGQVTLGVQYGPTGSEYTGTLTATGGGTVMLRRR